jgi:tetratricopeptide (TPR) repeat protein
MDRLSKVLGRLVAILLVSTGSARPAAAQAADVEVVPVERMLAAELARYVRVAAGSDLMDRSTFESGVALAEIVTQLDPDNPASWNLLLDAATIAEDDAARSLAIREIVRLDPDDQRARLFRIQMAIDTYQSADERSRAYATLLAAGQRQKLGAAVASRLAYDYAVLLRRMGDTDGFAEWLSESVALDSANRTAAALAAGYFSSQIDDPFGRAELLVNVQMADPADFSTTLTLAQLLLQHGAYNGAARMYDLASHGRDSINQSVSAGVFADQLIALWGAGRTDEALDMIRERQHIVNVLAQNMRLKDDPSLTRIDVTQVRGTLPATVALVRSAILAQRDSQERDHAYVQLDAAYEDAIRQLEADDAATAEAIAALWIERAFALLWFGDEIDKAKTALEEADALAPLNETAARRYEALIALRQDQPERAMELVADMINGDDWMARLILADAAQQLGNTRDAARQWLIVNNAQPGTLLGVWSNAKLVDALDRRLPLSTVASQLEELIASIPVTFDRYPMDPSSYFTLRIDPVRPAYKAYEPILVRLTLENHTNRPIAIDPNGPIRPTVAVIVDGRMTNYRGAEKQRPIVINIGNRLRLDAQESFSVVFDLRHYTFAQHVNRFALLGAIVRVRGYTNFASMTNGELAAGLLGMRTESDTFRVDGQRVDNAWVDRTVERMMEREWYSADRLRDLAFLAHVAEQGQSPEAPTAPDVDADRIDQVIDVVIESFGTLSPTQQAWMLMVMPSNAIFKPVLDTARQVDDPLVHIAYLLRGLQNDRDPMLAAGERSEHESVRSVAMMMRRSFELRGQAVGSAATESSGANRP